MEMLPDSFGNSRRAIIRHDGQHDVARKRLLRRDLFEKVARFLDRADVRADGDLYDRRRNPSAFIAATNFAAVTSLPNCPANDGATMATTSLPSRMERTT